MTLFTELFTQNAVHLLGSSTVLQMTGASGGHWRAVSRTFRTLWGCRLGVSARFRFALRTISNLPFLGSSIVFGGKRVDDGVIKSRRENFQSRQVLEVLESSQA